MDLSEAVREGRSSRYRKPGGINGWGILIKLKNC